MHAAPARRPTGTRIALFVLIAAAVVQLVSVAPARAQTLPARLADTTFWRMVTEFSEPGGFFRSDNFVSNETSFQYVIPTLQKTVKPTSVYIGVAPDQNFTYIVALRPKMAFIVDIRHQNALEHLMYKATLELSADRAEFLSRLFSRPRPPGLDTTSTADALFRAYFDIHPDSTLFKTNFEAIRERLVKTHGFSLTAEELEQLKYVFGAFYSAGPELTYNFGQGGGFRGGFGRMPDYEQLMMETDGHAQRSYVATEENFRTLKDMEERNLIVPLTGNFAGDKALRTVGRYLRDHGATVGAFYTSNVEQYLLPGSHGVEAILFECRHHATRLVEHLHQIALERRHGLRQSKPELAAGVTALLDYVTGQGIRRGQNPDVLRHHRALTSQDEPMSSQRHAIPSGSLPASRPSRCSSRPRRSSAGRAAAPANPARLRDHAREREFPRPRSGRTRARDISSIRSSSRAHCSATTTAPDTTASTTTSRSSVGSRPRRRHRRTVRRSRSSCRPACRSTASRSAAGASIRRRCRPSPTSSPTTISPGRATWRTWGTTPHASPRRAVTSPSARRTLRSAPSRTTSTRPSTTRSSISTRSSTRPRARRTSSRSPASKGT